MAPYFRPSLDPEDAVSVVTLTRLSRPVVREPHRRHRWLTAPSGWLLFACLFLPAWKPCSTGEPLPMAIFPMAWPPYLAGLMIALVAMASTRQQIEARGTLVLVLVRFTAISVAGFALLALVDDGVAIETAITVKVATVVALLVPWRGTEQAIAQTTFVVGVAICAMMTSFARSPEAMWGVHLAAVAAGGIVVGSAWWWIDLRCALRVMRA